MSPVSSVFHTVVTVTVGMVRVNLCPPSGLALFEKKMTEIVRMLTDDMALQNIYDADPLRHNDDEYHHPIVILV